MDTPDTPDTPDEAPPFDLVSELRNLAADILKHNPRQIDYQDAVRHGTIAALIELLEHARYQSHVAQQMEALLAQLGPAADAIAAGGIGGALGLLRAVQQG